MASGEFEAGFDSNGQTKEHALLARSLGVTQLLVAINKLDVAEPPWAQARYDAIAAQLAPFLESTGFRPDKVRCVTRQPRQLDCARGLPPSSSLMGPGMMSGLAGMCR